MSDRRLLSVNAAIHDRWFDLDAMTVDRDRGELRITVYPGRVRGRIIHTVRPPLDDDLPEPLGELVVRGVVDVEVNDEAGIRWYEIGGLDIDETATHLTLRSNFPLEIAIRVRELDIEFVDQRA